MRDEGSLTYLTGLARGSDVYFNRMISSVIDKCNEVVGNCTAVQLDLGTLAMSIVAMHGNVIEGLSISIMNLEGRPLFG